MSTGTIWQTESSSSDATFALGERLGNNCRGGEVLVLTSDLGGGKTTLAKGLAKGLGSTQVVGSPTFTVSRVYKGRDNLEMHHFDFYRLNDAGVVGYELAEVIDDPKTVVVIEWGDIVNEVLPDKRVIVKLERTMSGEDNRLISIEYPEQMKYLMKGLA